MADNIYELNDTWLEAHKTHSLCWTTHTVFDNKQKAGGNKFKECTCYTCRQQARQLMEHVAEISVPIKKPRNIVSLEKSQTYKFHVVYIKNLGPDTS